MQGGIFHEKAREVIRAFPVEARKSIGKAILDLQKGHHLTLPLSKPIPSVGLGVDELRIKDSSGIYRVFYYKKNKQGILILHAFIKKTQKTAKHEIEIGKRRLKEML